MHVFGSLLGFWRLEIFQGFQVCFIRNLDLQKACVACIKEQNQSLNTLCEALCNARWDTEFERSNGLYFFTSILRLFDIKPFSGADECSQLILT